MERISEKLSGHLPFVYLSWKSRSVIRIFLNGKIEEKEADIYRSSNFFLQKEYIRNIYANS